MDFELAIIGGGPAGYSAGIYAVRAGIRTVLFDKGGGGGLASIAPNIENYAGFPSISGMDLMEKMKQHASRYVDLHLYEEVESIVKNDTSFLITTSEEKTYKISAILIATGTEHRKLVCPGATEFEGRGVSYCATCDGFFFKNKKVAVVGGGNSALIEAIYLKQIGCTEVYLIHRRDKLRAEEAYEHDAKKAGVRFIFNTAIEEIKGNEKVASIQLKDISNGKISTVAVDGIFVSIGVLPENTVAKGLGVLLDEYGYIKVDGHMRTNVKGVFAAGDITGGIRQIITAAAAGAIAALTSTEVLGKKYPY